MFTMSRKCLFRSKFLKKFAFPFITALLISIVFIETIYIYPKPTNVFMPDIRKLIMEEEFEDETIWFGGKKFEETIPTISLHRRELETTSVTDVDAEWQLEHENIPNISLIQPKRKSKKEFANNCAIFPNLYRIKFSNIHWQVQATDAEVYYLYNAYLDFRAKLNPNSNQFSKRTFIVILAMSNKPNLTVDNSRLKFCQLWFERRAFPGHAHVTRVRLTWNLKWGQDSHYFPYLVTCELPSNNTELPVSVSLVPTACTNATNNLNLIHRDRYNTSRNSTRKNDIAVCVKALDFPDGKMRYRLIEWIETLKALGAAKIFFYEYFVHSDIKAALDFYEKQNFVDVVHTTLPGELPNQAQLRHLFVRGSILEKRLTELIPYNDCFYRNIYDYKYIAVMDYDEMIVPMDTTTWSQLIDLIVEQDIGMAAFYRKPVSTFCFQNVYFLDEMMKWKYGDVSSIPVELHMQRHIWRSRNSTNTKYMKCFHSTQETLAVHNHFAFFCTNGKKCNRHYVHLGRGQMNHYRSMCVEDIKNCSVYKNDKIKDTTLWRYQNEIRERVQDVLDKLEN